MSTQIALLRGINVGGRKPLAMAGLRSMLDDLGFADARSLLQSGNLVFDARASRGAALQRLLEAEIDHRFGQNVTVLVRSAREWQALVAGNPFASMAQTNPNHLVAMPLRMPPTATAVAALRRAADGPERMEAVGRTLYITYPNGIGRSRLGNALIEKTLATRGTARNWNTVLRLAAMAGKDG